MSDIVKQFMIQRKYQTGGPLYSPSELPMYAQEQLARSVGVNPKVRLTITDRAKKWLMNLDSRRDTDVYNAQDWRNNGHGVIQSGFLFDRNTQDKYYTQKGYKRVYNDYGLVAKAASRYKTPLPIYQKSNDVITRDQLIPIGNEDGDDQFYKKENYVKPTNWYSDPGRALYAAGHQRTAFYYNPNNGKYYQKTWDLNDYGGGSFFGTNPFGLWNLLDKIGNPVVVTTGFQEILPQYIKYVENTYMVPYAKKNGLIKKGNLYKRR